METVLSVEHIKKTYDGTAALDDVSLSFNKGEVHAIAGENGAGKSTLIKIISGFISPDSGKIIIGGKNFSEMTPKGALENGISVIYQDAAVMPDLSVADNIMLGTGEKKGFFVDKNSENTFVSELFERLGICLSPKEEVKNLSTAQIQLMQIAKAAAVNAKIIIMDEPTAALSSDETKILFTLIEKMKANGTAVVYISHRISEIYKLSDSISIFRDGKLIKTDRTEKISRAELIGTMVGRPINEAYPKRETELGEEILRVDGLSGNGIADITFSLRKGEILGIAGLLGSGRTEMVRLLFGADGKEAGEIFLNGKKVEISSPGDAVNLGIGYVPEDRKSQGIMMGLSVRENMSLPVLKRISKFLLYNKEKESNLIQKYREALRIKTPSDRHTLKSLSGGNQQKVVVAKWLASESQILIFDEPTQGIDVGAKQEIYNIMDKLTEKGISIIMISSELEELVGMADRIIVMREGKVVGAFDERKSFSKERILSLALNQTEGGAA